MSQKITAKNLQYNTTLPPFLARLHGETGPSDRSAPDPILAARRRPAKKRSGSAEAEDLPTVVDEHGNTVSNVTLGVDGSATVLDEKVGGEIGEATTAQHHDGGDDSKATSTAEQDGKTSIGASKKRKVGKVIGQDADEDDDNDDKQPPKKGKPSITKPTTSANDDKEGKDGETPKPKAKKKAKKIKLSFGDEEG